MDQGGKVAVVIHGGAGVLLRDQMSAEAEELYKEGLRQAVIAARDILLNGGLAIEAVEAACVSLEDCPLFNAGKGT